MLFENTHSPELIHTKLSLPRRGSARIHRAALLKRLDAGLEQKLTLISAPAGSGKTTLAAGWIDALPPGSVAWVSLDAGDNDPVRFWRYVFAAIQTVDPQAGETALALLDDAQSVDDEAVLTALINRLAQRSNQLVLILEDYHEVTNACIHAAITFLMDHLPLTMHLALLTRSEPPLPLARWQLHGEITELRATDLRFTVEEAHAFLEQALGRPLAEQAAARLAERTEGWAAGLRLVAMALRQRALHDDWDESVDHFIETFAGSHRPLLDYLLADVLACLDEGDEIFLLETSRLERLSAELCEAVTGRTDSAEMLDRLEQLNLFIVPLENVGGGEWRRYQSLFAEAMRYLARQRLSDDRRHELGLNAARWHADHDQMYEAVEAALSVREYGLAAGWIEHCVPPRLAGNEYHTLLRWIEMLPLETRRIRPGLCLIHALAILFTSEVGPQLPMERLKAPLVMAEAGFMAQGDAERLAEVSAVRALAAGRQGDYAAAHALAVQALENLPESAVEWRGVSLSFSGWGQYVAGRMDAALRELSESRLLCQVAGNLYGVLSAMLGLAEVQAERGDLQAAAELFRQTLAEIERAPIARKDRLRRQGKALLGLAELAYTADDLPAAEQQADQVLNIGAEAGSDDLLAQAEWILARVIAARGDLKAARGRLYALAARLQHPRLQGQVQSWLARLALASGDAGAVQRWASFAEDAEHLPPLYREQQQLLLARAHIAQGEAEAALPALQAILCAARDGSRVRQEVETLLVMAQAQSVSEQTAAAQQTLAQALSLAPVEHFRRIYLDEGAGMAALLDTFVVEPAPAPAVTPSRESFHTPAAPDNRQKPAPFGLPPAGAADGTLSRQERRVLRLLAAGMSNPEIADELVVSVNTVKTHVKSIYRKLNVNSRRSVRQAARQCEAIF